MTPEKLREHLDHEPFVPLRLHLASGTAIGVLRPSMAQTLRHTLMVFKPNPAKSAVMDYSEINYRLIERIETLSNTAPA